MASKIQKGELLSYATCAYGEEDQYDRFVAKEDLVLMTKKEYDVLTKGGNITFDN